MQICIFEDDKTEQFKPLTLSRPVYDLVCGINTLREKIERHFPGGKISLHCRKYLVESVKTHNPKIVVNKILDDECLFINGRILFNKKGRPKGRPFLLNTPPSGRVLQLFDL